MDKKNVITGAWLNWIRAQRCGRWETGSNPVHLIGDIMSFDKNYPNRKDWRKPYRKSKAFDASCRPHGTCGWCQGNRQHQYNRQMDLVDSLMEEWEKDYVEMQERRQV